MDESQSLKEIRKEHVVLVLRSTEGDIVQATKILGISVGHLRSRIKDWESMLRNGKTQGSDTLQETLFYVTFPIHGAG